MIEIEVKEYVQLKILEDKIAELRRVYDEDAHISDSTFYTIFGWERKAKETFSVSTSPAIVSTPALVKTIVPPPPKPMTSKKGEMMAKVKSLHLKGLNGKQIAEKTGLSESTVSTYKKEMGLIGEASLTLLNSPGNCSGATAVGN